MFGFVQYYFLESKERIRFHNSLNELNIVRLVGMFLPTSFFRNSLSLLDRSIKLLFCNNMFGHC